MKNKIRNNNTISTFLVWLLFFWGIPLLAENEKNYRYKTVNFPKEIHTLKNFVYDEISGELKTDVLGGAKNQKDKTLSQSFSIDFDEHDKNLVSKMKLLAPGYIGQAGHFIQAQNAIYCSNLSGAFFNGHSEIGDFTISFRVLFNDVNGFQTIMEKINFVIDSHANKLIEHGFRWYLKNRRLGVTFHNFFHFQEKKKTFEMVSDTSIWEEKWYHVGLIYKDNEGTLSLYLDGEHQLTIRTTENQKWGSRQYYPGFLSTTQPLILGKKLLGKLDEINFYSISKENFIVKKYPDVPSEFTSTLLSLPSHTRIEQIEVEGDFNQEYLTAYVRFSENYFPWKEASTFFNSSHLYPKHPLWQQVSLGQPLLLPMDGGDDSYTKHYVQIRLLLNNYGLEKPSTIRRISLVTSTDLPPQIPIVKYVIARPSGFRIAWKKSSEQDIMGYHIDYASVEYSNQTRRVKQNRITLYKKDLMDQGMFIYEVKRLKSKIKYQVSLRAFDFLGEKNMSLPTPTWEISPYLPRKNNSL